MDAGDCEPEVCHPLANTLGKMVTCTGQAESSGASLEQRSPEPQLQGLDPLTYSALATGGQARSGLGLAAQQEAVQRFVAAEGLELIGELRGRLGERMAVS